MVIAELMEWIGGKTKPRFKKFREAKWWFERFKEALGQPFVTMSAETRKAFVNDPGLDKVEMIYRDVLKQCIEENANKDAAIVWYQLGLLYQLQYRIDEAINAYKNAMEIYKNTPVLNRNDKATISDTHYHLGFIALDLDDREKAKREFDASIAIDRAIGNSRSIQITETALRRYNLI